VIYGALRVKLIFVSAHIFRTATVLLAPLALAALLIAVLAVKLAVVSLVTSIAACTGCKKGLFSSG
jgi:hypothetical protein